MGLSDYKTKLTKEAGIITLTFKPLNSTLRRQKQQCIE